MTVVVHRAPPENSGALNGTSPLTFMTDDLIERVTRDSQAGKVPTLNDLQNSLVNAVSAVCGIAPEQVQPVSWDRSEVSLGNYAILNYGYTGPDSRFVIERWNKEALGCALRDATPLP